MAVLADCGEVRRFMCQQWRADSALPRPGAAWDRLGHGHLPQLYAGRSMRLGAQVRTNLCLYGLLTASNRRSSDVPRADFLVEEVVELTLSLQT